MLLSTIQSPVTRSQTRLTQNMEGKAEPRAGLLRCVCNNFLMSLQDVLVECSVCKNWLHAHCMGFVSSEIPQHFICPICTGEPRKRPRGGDRPHRQLTLKLSPISDVLPSNAARLRTHLTRLKKRASQRGFDIIDIPSKTFTDEVVQQCIECCAQPIQDATFSESYPKYCFQEIQQEIHKYVQGSLCCEKTSGKVVSLVLTNGMDPYGNLKQTINQLRCAHAKVQQFAASPFLDVGDVSDFVHFTLIATHPDFRSRGCATELMLCEMLKWCMRGRNRAFLNMALKKRMNGNDKLVCSVPEASSRLYRLFEFVEVYPKYTPEGDLRWTPKEADMGRVMANLDLQGTIVRVCNSVETNSNVSSEKHV